MFKTTANKKVNGHAFNGCLLATAFAVALAFDADASILSPVIKAGGRVAARVFPHAVVPTVRGGAKLAAVTAARRTVVKTAGGLSGRKILAIGGGTAMVTAAHECADGVQGLCEAAGQTIRENPDKAGNIMDALMRPLSALVVTLSLAFAGLLWWFFGPWLRLVRNWSKLQAARRAVKLQLAYEQIGCPQTGEEMLGRPGKISVRMVVAFAGLALSSLLVLAYCMKGVDTHRVNVDAVDVSSEVARMKSDYASEIKSLHEQFVREVEEVSAAQFDKIRMDVPEVTAKFGTFSKCKDLMVDLVVDRLRGGDRTGEGIRRDLEGDYYRGLYGANDAVNDCVIRFAAKLEDCRKRFAQAMKGYNEVALPDETEYARCLQGGGDLVEAGKSNLASGQLAAGVAVATEAIFIRQTVSTVAKILGKAAARQAATMAGGAVAAVADGPLPIGDIAAFVGTIGCSAWTCYEVWQATKILPRELNETLVSVADQSESECRAAALSVGNNMLKVYAGFAA